MLILQSRIVGAFNSFDAQYNFLRFTGVECAASYKADPGQNRSRGTAAVFQGCVQED